MHKKPYLSQVAKKQIYTTSFCEKIFGESSAPPQVAKRPKEDDSAYIREDHREASIKVRVCNRTSGTEYPKEKGSDK